MFFALTMALTVNFASAAELTLRSNISIIDNIVTLGDLFENAGAAADIAVFRSPKLGKKGFLKSKRIKLAAREHGLIWLNRKYLENIVVHRQAQVISLDEISNRIGEEITNRFPRRIAGSHLEISFSNTALPLIMRADAVAGFDIQKIRYNGRSGRFSALIIASARLPEAKRVTYVGRATEMIEVPMLVQNLRRGKTITRRHLETKKVPARRINETTVTEAIDLIGMATRRSLRAHSLIRSSDVEKPKIVRKNTLISVVYRLNSLHITFRGRAMEDGALGETISVLNPRSRRTIQATVSAPNMVTARGNTPRQTASLSQ